MSKQSKFNVGDTVYYRYRHFLGRVYTVVTRKGVVVKQHPSRPDYLKVQFEHGRMSRTCNNPVPRYKHSVDLFATEEEAYEANN